MKLSRGLLALSLVGLVSTCAEPTGNGVGAGFARMAVPVVLPPASLMAPGLVLDRVKIVVGKSIPQQEVFIRLDSAEVSLTPSQNTAQARIQLVMSQVDTFRVIIDYLASDGTVLFVAGTDVIVTPGRQISLPPTQPFYVGPGFNIASMTLSPADSQLSAGDTLTIDPRPVDVQGAPVSPFYVSWLTDDPRVPIDALGRITAPATLTKLLTVTANTPNGVSASTTVTLLGASALGLSPDSVEKVPGSTQQFQVVIGGSRAARYFWSVDGIDGGNSTVGTVDSTGLYTAPARVPSPARVDVCAQLDDPEIQRDGCAVVVIKAVPTVGADLVVINDINIFDQEAMNPDSSIGNVRFVKNLVNFSGTGPRTTGTVVWYDRGRNSPCMSVDDMECADSAKATLDSVIQSTGKTIVKFDTLTTFTNIPSNVKVIFLWMPLVQYSLSEINLFKRFAAEGGRIVFMGENGFFYGQAGLDLQNNFLLVMGSQMTNVGDVLDCRTNDPFQYFKTPSKSLRSNPLLSGVTSLRYVCASKIVPGPGDSPFLFDQANTSPIAAVTKIDVTPIIGSSPPAASRGTGPVAGATGGGRIR
ncbi:MAG: hypothetical protein U0133_05125 [Gemmatimonadales bacterium]